MSILLYFWNVDVFRDKGKKNWPKLVLLQARCHHNLRCFLAYLSFQWAAINLAFLVNVIFITFLSIFLKWFMTFFSKYFSHDVFSDKSFAFCILHNRISQPLIGRKKSVTLNGLRTCHGRMMVQDIQLRY